MSQAIEAVTCSVADTSFRMLVSNDWERNRAGTLLTKEPETVRWIVENFRAGDTLFDIGANNGVYALLAAAHARQGRVVAVEPMAATFARLCENVCSTASRTSSHTASRSPRRIRSACSTSPVSKPHPRCTPSATRA